MPLPTSGIGQREVASSGTRVVWASTPRLQTSPDGLRVLYSRAAPSHQAEVLHVMYSPDGVLDTPYRARSTQVSTFLSLIPVVGSP